MKEFYKRHLPHLQPTGGTFFVTFNLYGSITKEVFDRWEEEYAFEKEKIIQLSIDKNADLEHLGKLYFAKRDKFLDTYKEGNHYLKSDTLAKIVADSLHFWDNKKIELYSFCIMSNHVHVVLRLLNDTEIENPWSLDKFMQSIKSFSAKKCNTLLGQEGRFWQEESYDRLVRDDVELRRILIYILNNPVKAGLCQQMKDWKWSYIKEIYNDII